MSKELNKTTEEIMTRIHEEQIKMRPRVYFVFGYILAIMGLVFSFITSIFFIGVTRFSLRSHGPMGEYHLEQILSNFSWWMPLLAILGLITGIYLLRRYDFSYKINFKILVIGIIVSIFLAGWIIDMTGLNDFWIHGGNMQGYGQRQFRMMDNINFNNSN